MREKKDTTQGPGLRGLAWGLYCCVHGAGEQPAARMLGEAEYGHALFCWLPQRKLWCVVGLDTSKVAKWPEKIAVVTLVPPTAFTVTIHTLALAWDMTPNPDDPRGEWVVDQADLERLKSEYGGALVILWQQE